MKPTENLKGQSVKAQTKEEARDTIKEAGMLLDDEELETVSGGLLDNPFMHPEGKLSHTVLLVCPACGREVTEWDTSTPLSMDPCPHCYVVPNRDSPWVIDPLSRW